MLYLTKICYCNAPLSGTHADNGRNIHYVFRFLIHDLHHFFPQRQSPGLVIRVNYGITLYPLTGLDGFYEVQDLVDVGTSTKGFGFNNAFASPIQGNDRFKIHEFSG